MTKLGDFLKKDLKTLSTSDDERSDPETDILNFSASAGGNEDDGALHSDNVGTRYSLSASSASLEMSHSSYDPAASSTNTSKEEAREDEFQDEGDDEGSKSAERSGYNQPSTNATFRHQRSPVTNSTSVVDINGKARSRRFSETSSFPTPPQTPPNIRKVARFSSRQLSNTFPRKSGSQRTSSSRATGTPTKSRRRPVIAKYRSVCKLCESLIIPGRDKITRLDSGAIKSWVHQKCVNSK